MRNPSIFPGISLETRENPGNGHVGSPDCRQKSVFKIIIGIPTTADITFIFLGWHHSSDFTRTPSFLEESISLKTDRALTPHLDDMIYYNKLFGKSKNRETMEAE